MSETKGFLKGYDQITFPICLFLNIFCFRFTRQKTKKYIGLRKSADKNNEACLRNLSGCSAECRLVK